MRQFRGATGSIAWHDYTAATVYDYTVVRGEAGEYHLTGVAGGDRKAFHLSQRPLIFVAPHERGAFRWPVLALEIAPSGRLSARLGPLIPSSPLEIRPGKDLTIA